MQRGGRRGRSPVCSEVSRSCAGRTVDSPPGRAPSAPSTGLCRTRTRWPRVQGDREQGVLAVCEMRSGPGQVRLEQLGATRQVLDHPSVTPSGVQRVLHPRIGAAVRQVLPRDKVTADHAAGHIDAYSVVPLVSWRPDLKGSGPRCRPAVPALLRHRPGTRPRRRQGRSHPAVSQWSNGRRKYTDQAAQTPDLWPGRLPTPAPPHPAQLINPR